MTQAAKQNRAYCRDLKKSSRQTLINDCAQEIVRFRFPLLQGLCIRAENPAADPPKNRSYQWKAVFSGY